MSHGEQSWEVLFAKPRAVHGTSESEGPARGFLMAEHPREQAGGCCRGRAGAWGARRQQQGGRGELGCPWGCNRQTPPRALAGLHC